MTKPDQDDTNRCDMQRILAESLIEAKRKGRVTCGLFQTAEALERNPSLGGICILPNETLQYQEDECLLFMMETYCRENIIPIIKVNDMVKLAEHVGLNYSEAANGDELNCILIKTSLPGLRKRNMINQKIEILEKICHDFAKEDRQIVIDN